jgi:hypothetical protein
MYMNEDEEKNSERFVSRWSRLKQNARSEPAAAPSPPAAPEVDHKGAPPELPALDKLTMDSDFSGFLHPQVDENLRRAALKKLFADPHFNVIDLMDVYIDDYTLPNVLPAEMLSQLRHAKKIIDWAKEGKPDEATESAALPAENVPPQLPDETAAQDLAPAVPDIEHSQEAEQKAEPQPAPARKTQT